MFRRLARSALVDEVFGGAGTDELMTSGGNDYLRGGDGVDYLYGGEGNDHLYGDRQIDHLLGGDGDDWLFGNAGSDRLHVQAGNDFLTGGGGNDRFFISDRDWSFPTATGHTVVTDFTRGTDKLQVSNGGYAFADFNSDGNGRLNDADAHVAVGPSVWAAGPASRRWSPNATAR